MEQLHAHGILRPGDLEGRSFEQFRRQPRAQWAAGRRPGIGQPGRDRRCRFWRAGVGGQPAGGIAPSTGGVGVQGVAGGVADGVVGTTDAHFKSGVFGFNSLALTAQNITGFGVFGRCDTAGGGGLGGESQLGNGARAHSAENDGVVGLSDALNKSGVYGFNSREDGAAYGVFGRCAANDGAGVGADSTLGVRVRGQSQFNNAVVGLSEGGTKSGVLGVNSFASGPAFGVSGRADSAHGVGVAGASERGYGASFRGGLAPLRIEPSASAGSPRRAPTR
jgi:hypothetical protein